MRNKALQDTFLWLFLGLLCTFTISFLISNNETAMISIFNLLGNLTYIIFIIVEFGLAIFLQVRINNLKPVTAKIVYILYTSFTGLTLSVLLRMYSLESISYVFLATAICFLAFAIIGKTTKIDLSKWGIYLFFTLISIIILELINIFLMNNTLNMLICIIGVLLFCAYTAYDINRALDQSFLADSENKGVYCALQLFIDFINLFIELLRLFGDRRD